MNMHPMPVRNRPGHLGMPTVNEVGAMMVELMQGKWYRAAKEGRVFYGNMAAAGAVVPIYSATAQVCGLWNPAGNGKLAVPIAFLYSYVDTTWAAGGWTLAQNKNAGAAVGATGAPIEAFTETTPECSRASRKGGNSVRFGTAATVAAPTIKRQLGLNQSAATAAGTSVMPYNNIINFDGDVIVEPNEANWIAGNIAILGKVAGTLVWAEEDI